MQVQSSSQSSNDSDNGEGFIPCQNNVQQKKQSCLNKKQQKKNQQKKQFLPRYILDGIMRKEPTQCHQRFMNFDYIQQFSKKNTNSLEDEANSAERNQNTAKQALEKKQKPTRKDKNNLLTPYDKYIQTGEYTLVYSRYKDFKFTKEEINFSQHDVKLDCLRFGQETNYKTIKPFQIIDDKSKQFFMQNAPKSNQTENILKFDSKFQCGNLLCAFKHKNESYAYTLFIQNDTNTYGYNHWFYFSVKNAQVKVKYRFHLVNFRKQHSFFKSGNRPVIFSMIDSRKQGMSGYSKRGDAVKYEKSPIVKCHNSKESFYQLSFSLDFWNENDIYYISTGLPYSYSKLLKNLGIYEELAQNNKVKWIVGTLGTSIGGNNIPYITITKIQDDAKLLNSSESSKLQNGLAGLFKNQEIKTQSLKRKVKSSSSQIQPHKKKVIFLTARQHPGETWSSYLMDEFMHCLVTERTPEVDYILQNFIIKCVPMVNVDGVISGNFRCDLAGMDLNRSWRHPSQLLHPQVFAIKNQLESLIEKGCEVSAYFDLHSHSKEYNIFCYSCKTDNYQCRILPYLLSQFCDEFYFPLCTFGVSKEKLSTARAVVFQMTRNPNTLTIETSFFGKKTNGKIQIFQPENFSKIALCMVKACKSYFSHDENFHKTKQAVKDRIQEFMQYQEENSNHILSGSDSEPSEDEMQISQKLEKIIPKSLLENCSEIQNIKKTAKKRKKKVKKKTFAKFFDKKTLSETVYPSLQPIKEENREKSTITDWESIRIKKNQYDERQYNKTQNFKNRSFIMSNKTIDDENPNNNSKGFLKQIIDRQQHKLPFSSRQKPEMIPIRLKNQSLEIFKDAYNATQKQIKVRYGISSEDMKNQRRLTNRKLIACKDFSHKAKQMEEFPVLCVLSESKKKRHLQMLQESQSPQVICPRTNKNKIKTAIQARTEAIKQLRQRNKDNVDLVSKIWRQSYQRYGQGFHTFRIQDEAFE